MVFRYWAGTTSGKDKLRYTLGKSYEDGETIEGTVTAFPLYGPDTEWQKTAAEYLLPCGVQGDETRVSPLHDPAIPSPLEAPGVNNDFGGTTLTDLSDLDR